MLADRQSAIIRIAEFGETEILLLLVDGAPVEVHARRHGVYHQKRAQGSISPRSIAPVDFNRLIAAAGGVDRPVRATPRAGAFQALLTQLRPGSPGTETCPGDFALKSVAEKAALRGTVRTSAINHRYFFCYDPQPTAHFRLATTGPMANWRIDHDASIDGLVFSGPGISAVWSLG